MTRAKVKTMGRAKMAKARAFVDSHIAHAQVKAEAAAERKFNIPTGSAAHLRKGVKLALKTKKSMAAKRKGGGVGALGGRVRAMGGAVGALGGAPAAMGGGIFDRFRRKKKTGSDTSKALESASTVPVPTGEIPPHAKIYAAAAQAAYTVPSPENLKDPATGNIWKRLEGNRDRQVYTLGNKAIIAYKGTDNLADLAVDTALVTGFQGYTYRFKEALRLAKRINQTYETSCTGHSLGGALALHVAQRVPNITAYLFNAGAGLNMAGCRGGRCKNVKAFTTGKDFMSVATRGLGKAGSGSEVTSIGVQAKSTNKLSGAAKAAAMYLGGPAVMAGYGVKRIVQNHTMDNFFTDEDRQAQEGLQ